MRVMKPVTTSRLITLNVEIMLYPTFGEYVASSDGGGYEFVRRDPVEPDINIRTFRSPRYSAWEVRRDFVDPADTQIEEFVDLYGRFASERFDLTMPNRRDWFWRCKDFVRELDSTPIQDWHPLRQDYADASVLLDLKLPFDQEWTMSHSNIGSPSLVPIGRLSFRTSLEAIVASILIDKANGSEFGFCVVCGREFEKTSRHHRTYDNPECGDVLRQRRRRERQRATITGEQTSASQSGDGHS
jgi:predicted RNA-binding Zn-ribbon protein involved in translation (DUF1610 family)